MFSSLSRFSQRDTDDDDPSFLKVNEFAWDDDDKQFVATTLYGFAKVHGHQ
jgi:hypothetical protein